MTARHPWITDEAVARAWRAFAEAQPEQRMRAALETVADEALAEANVLWQEGFDAGVQEERKRAVQVIRREATRRYDEAHVGFVMRRDREHVEKVVERDIAWIISAIEGPAA